MTGWTDDARTDVAEWAPRWVPLGNGTSYKRHPSGWVELREDHRPLGWTEPRGDRG